MAFCAASPATSPPAGNFPFFDDALFALLVVAIARLALALALAAAIAASVADAIKVDVGDDVGDDDDDDDGDLFRLRRLNFLLTGSFAPVE